MSVKVRAILIISSILFLINSVEAQKLQLLSKTNKLPIANVIVFNLEETVYTQSDSSGIINLNIFKNEDMITFRHPSYQTMILPREELVKLDYLYFHDHILEMNEVVVSASKWEQDQSEIANDIAYVSRKQIESRSPQTSADLLEQTGEIFVQKSQFGGGSPMLRGFAANSVLIIVDGLRMNNAIFRSGNLQNILSIDPFSIENTEVIFGPGSVMYGSDALGGVMDFHIKSPDLSKEKSFSGGAFLRYSTASNEKTGHINILRSGPVFSWYSSFSNSDMGDLRAGKKFNKLDPDFGKRLQYIETISGTDYVIDNKKPHIQVGSGYQANSLVNKFKFRISSFSEFDINTYYSTTGNVPRYDRLIQYRNGSLRYGEWFYGPQKWMRNNITFTTKKQTSFYDEARVILARQDFSESRNSRNLYNTELTSRNEKVTGWHFNADFDKELKENSRIFYGLEWFGNQVGSTAWTKDLLSGDLSGASTRYPDGGSQYQTLAAYVSINRHLTDRLKIQSGVRISQIKLHSEFTDTTFYKFPFNELNLNKSAVSGNIGAIFHPGKEWKLSLMGSTGFRAPNVDDAGKLFDSEPGMVIVPNDQLRPEYVYNTDLGISKNIYDKVKFRSTLFYSFIDDLIVRRDFLFNGMDSILYEGVLSKVEALSNSDQAQLIGISASLKAEIAKNLAISSSLSNARGQDSEGNSIRHIPPLFGMTSLIYKRTKWQVEFYSRYNGKIAFENLAPSEQDKTHIYSTEGSLAWITFNIRGYWEVNDHVNLYAGLENIADTHYRTYSSGISAPGRNAFFSIKIQL